MAYSKNPKYPPSRLAGLCKHKGKTYEEAFGPEVAKRIKLKMRLAKLGKKRPPRTWALKGEKHWNWQGGITPNKRRIRSTLAWKQWREAVFKRDNFTCQECYKRGGKLEPHHIIPLVETLSRAFDVDNGITLCRTCHLKTIGKEKLFQKKYSEIVYKS